MAVNCLALYLSQFPYSTCPGLLTCLNNLSLYFQYTKKLMNSFYSPIQQSQFNSRGVKGIRVRTFCSVTPGLTSVRVSVCVCVCD